MALKYLFNPLTGKFDLVDVASASGGNVSIIRFDLTTAVAQTSVTAIPAGAIVTNAFLDITTPYSPGSSIQVGQLGAVSLLMSNSDSDSAVANQYEAPQDTDWGPLSLPVLVTVSGSPVVGAGICVVTYTQPNP